MVRLRPRRGGVRRKTRMQATMTKSEDEEYSDEESEVSEDEEYEEEDEDYSDEDYEE